MAVLYLPPEGEAIATSDGRCTVNWYRSFFLKLMQVVPSGGAAPSDPQFIVAAADAGLANERVATSTTSITVDNATAAQTQWKRAALSGDVAAAANSNATTLVIRTADPGAPADDTWWLFRDGGSPETVSLKVRIGGVTTAFPIGETT